MKKLVTIPFAGFYYSVHDSELDCALEQMFSNYETGDAIDGLVSHASDACDWSQVFKEYAQEYTENFGKEFGIHTLKFESLESPKYYNFSTDRIFAHVDYEELQRIYNEVDKDELAIAIKDKFTSRSGFISFYANSIEEWGPFEDWDFNQYGTLIEVFVGELDGYKEIDLMENARGNGGLDNMISSAIKDVGRLYKICDYLNKREKRNA